MQISGTMESRKSELTLDINSFDKPKELSSVGAWSQLILNLMFIKPGTYPSIPELGIGIEDYQYEYMDTAIDQLTAAITNQQQTYLPDIPLSQVNVSKMEKDGQPILIIQLFFNVDEGTATSAIALNVSKRNFLNFDVSW